MNIYTTQEINRIYSSALRQQNIHVHQLIDRGARGVVSEIEKRWPAGTPIHVYAGPYENGALALAVGRNLYKNNHNTKITLFNIKNDPAQEICRQQREYLFAAGFPKERFTEIVTSYSLPEFERDALVIDGIFGSELNGALKTGYPSFIKHINQCNVNVVSLDVPSGMSGDWNTRTVPNYVIKARLTICFQFPHLAFFLPNMAENVGEWIALDMGVKDQMVESSSQKYILIGKNEVFHFLPKRKASTSKADYGNGIIYAGSFGMLGAAVLSAKGALRAGIGKLTVSTPLCGFPVIQTAIPEALYQYAESQSSFSQIKPMHSYDAIAVGPGIGRSESTLDALDEFISTMPSPVILDADALNCISLRPQLLHKIPNMSIITPHAKEFDNLFGEQPNGDARIEKAIEMSKNYNIIIVMKGRHTAVVRPNGKLTFNNSGSAALATPGSGDVLTGVITAFFAQWKNPVLSSVAAVYVHGLAGDIAAKEHGEYGVLASDIADNIGKAIKEIMEQ